MVNLSQSLEVNFKSVWINLNLRKNLGNFEVEKERTDERANCISQSNIMQLQSRTIPPAQADGKAKARYGKNKKIDRMKKILIELFFLLINTTCFTQNVKEIEYELSYFKSGEEWGNMKNIAYKLLEIDSLIESAIKA